MSCLLLLLLATGSGVPAPAIEWPASPFDDPVTVLVPQEPRGERLERRLASAAFYAEARVYYRRRDFGKALRRLQRAWRYHPEARELLPQVLAWAGDLRRFDEALRYMEWVDDLSSLEPLLLRRLALHASGRQEWSQALRLYRAALQHVDAEQRAETMEVGDALLYFDMGRIHFLLGEPAEAAEAFSRIQPFLEHPERLSDNVTLQNMLLGQVDQTFLLVAESYLADGRPDAAEAMFRRAAETGEPQATLDYHLARVALERDQPEQALESWERYLDRAGGTAPHEAYELLAEILERLHGEGAAERLRARLTSLAEQAEADPVLPAFLGQWERERQRLEEAGQWYAEAVERGAGPAAWTALADIQRQQRRPAGFLDTLARAVREGLLLSELGELAERVADEAEEEFIEQVLAEARRRQDEDPDRAVREGVFWAAADLALHAGHYDRFQEQIETAGESRPPAGAELALLRWSVTLLLDDQFLRAVELLQRGVDESWLTERPEIGYFYLVRGLALADELDQALETAEAAVARYPDALLLQSLPGWVLLRSQRYARAAEAYQAVLERFDDIHDNPSVRDELRGIRLSLSYACVKDERRGEAEEWLAQVLDEFPDDAGALNDLGYLWTEEGRNLNWALQMLGRAVEQDPENAAYLDSLGWVHFQQGNYEKAVHWLEKAVSQDTTDGIILDHLGDAYQKVGQLEKALEAWRRAVQEFEEQGETSLRDATRKKIEQYEQNGM